MGDHQHAKIMESFFPSYNGRVLVVIESDAHGGGGLNRFLFGFE